MQAASQQTPSAQEPEVTRIADVDAAALASLFTHDTPLPRCVGAHPLKSAGQAAEARERNSETVVSQVPEAARHRVPGAAVPWAGPAWSRDPAPREAGTGGRGFAGQVQRWVGQKKAHVPDRHWQPEEHTAPAARSAVHAVPLHHAEVLHCVPHTPPLHAV